MARPFSFEGMAGANRQVTQVRFSDRFDVLADWSFEFKVGGKGAAVALLRDRY